MKILFTPVSLGAGLIAGVIAGKIFELVWGLFDDEEAPDPKHREFASYNKTYGALGGVIVFLVWLWITNIALLLGAELNAELERGRQIEAGKAADGEPFIEPRDTRKIANQQS